MSHMELPKRDWFSSHEDRLQTGGLRLPMAPVQPIQRLPLTDPLRMRLAKYAEWKIKHKALQTELDEVQAQIKAAEAKRTELMRALLALEIPTDEPWNLLNELAGQLL